MSAEHSPPRSGSDCSDKDLEKGDDVDSRNASVTEPAFTSAANEAQEPTSPNCDDWNGPDDPENPLQWPRWKKTYHTFIPAAIALVCTLASSIYTPGRDSLMAEFGVSAEVSLFPYVFYVLGLASGPMIAAPMSETYGRRAVYLTAIPIFALFTLGSGFCNNIAALTICRFFSGVFGSPGLSIGSATLADLYTPAERAIPMAIYITTPFLGPAIGPLVGGYVAARKDWRWTMWALLFFTIVGLVPAFGMKETYKSAILKKRAKKLGLPTKTSGRTATQSAIFFLGSTLTRPMHMAFVEPVVAAFTIYIALNFAMLYSFFAAFPVVFAEAYGFGIESTGFTFIGLGVGCIVGCGLVILFSKLVFKPQVARSHKESRGGKVPPEPRLYLAMIGGLCLPRMNSAIRHPLDLSCHRRRSLRRRQSPRLHERDMYLMDFYGPLYGASAMGANNIPRYLMGFAFPLFAVQMYERLGTGWATSLLSFISLALAAIPFLFYKFGPKLRAASKYQRSS
ncbi:hypothetical protein LTR78_008554 [Recurvomyces mirabilis]|uniref:Major facilitator superfamily (MFS) profile domain-containing protein n=1 Tax=Recurvomyces mirabilis TaxID=574656 RepID=A0AAE0TQH6_9PEZI|nr:hypothetical protein LTR78_008554 [Recurvomyces mirabilis]KAK5156305.1 hypothetical protein LTS14_005193 [Recurvomyces mirabilis]